MHKPERSGWRDETISSYHEAIGITSPFEFLAIEYDHCEPRALIEYRQTELDDFQAAPVAARADAAELPFFVVYWRDDYSTFRVDPRNAAARRLVAIQRELSERDYLRFLYLVLRGRSLQPSQLAAMLATIRERAGTGSISRWHRYTGTDAPVVDFDFIDNGCNVAIEYKQEFASIDYNSANIEAQRRAANLLDIPFFVVRYERDWQWLIARSCNPRAFQALGSSQSRKFNSESFGNFLRLTTLNKKIAA